MVLRFGRALLIAAGITVSGSATAECASGGYIPGSPIPAYTVLARRSLQDDWNAYVASYPPRTRSGFYRGPRLTDRPYYYDFRPIAEQCLVEVATLDGLGTKEQAIVQQPCETIGLSEVVRLVFWWYCIDVRTGPPDFYSFVPYQHAEIMGLERYPSELRLRIIKDESAHDYREASSAMAIISDWAWQYEQDPELFRSLISAWRAVIDEYPHLTSQFLRLAGELDPEFVRFMEDNVLNH